MTALFLRSVNQDFTSFGGFQWPREVGAIVEATNWNPTPECGQGLHGLMWGEGKASLLGDGDDPHLVVEADAATAVDLGGQHKFPSCTVRLVGTRDEAVAYLIANGAADKAVVYARKTGGDWSTLTGGDWAKLTGGYGATLTGGYGATLTGGDWSTLTGGDWAKLTGGSEATLTGGREATLTGGDEATLTGGDGATLSIRWWDGTRYRISVAYVGEDGIKPGVAYKLNGNGKFVKA